MIPLVIVEEHHEAFYVWQFAVRRGWIRGEQNTLLHADEHADCWLPRLRKPIVSLSELTDIARFVYSELDIGNFIWPAVYHGMFNRVLWLRAQHRRSSGAWREISISAKNADETEFTLSSHSVYTEGELGRSVQFSPITPNDEFTVTADLVLDIDLDYFCCNDYPKPADRRIEITRTAYTEFRENPYHFFRLMPGAKITSEERQGRYYLTCYDLQREEPSASARQCEIERRMTAFLSHLARNAVNPSLIVISRSIHSGYTPSEYAHAIEHLLLDQLRDRYQVNLIELDSILPADCKRTFGVEQNRRVQESVDLGILS
jgi:hypothetical protein